MSCLLFAISALVFSLFTLGKSNNPISTVFAFLGGVLAIVAIALAVKDMV